jgi:four helix bundle protein
MSRDHRKLRVFQMADALVVPVYDASRGFPIEERYGLQSQLRKAALSVATNLVEGCARRTTAEYQNFVNIATGSAAETRYLIEVAMRLGYVIPRSGNPLLEKFDKLVGSLKALMNGLDAMPRA